MLKKLKSISDIPKHNRIIYWPDIPINYGLDDKPTYSYALESGGCKTLLEDRRIMEVASENFIKAKSVLTDQLYKDIKKLYDGEVLELFNIVMVLLPQIQLYTRISDILDDLIEGKIYNDILADYYIIPKKVNVGKGGILDNIMKAEPQPSTEGAIINIFDEYVEKETKEEFENPGVTEEGISNLSWDSKEEAKESDINNKVEIKEINPPNLEEERGSIYSLDLSDTPYTTYVNNLEDIEEYRPELAEAHKAVNSILNEKPSAQETPVQKLQNYLESRDRQGQLTPSEINELIWLLTGDINLTLLDESQKDEDLGHGIETPNKVEVIEEEEPVQEDPKEPSEKELLLKRSNMVKSIVQEKRLPKRGADSLISYPTSLVPKDILGVKLFTRKEVRIEDIEENLENIIEFITCFAPEIIEITKELYKED